jgi:predicted NBD/HSP70 family sugar kinase
MERPLRPNQRRILAFLGRSAPTSRADLGRELGLPKATVAGLIAELVGLGLVTESAAGPDGTPGRPGRVVTLTGGAATIAVLSAYGDTLAATIVTTAGEIRSRFVRDLPRTESEIGAIEAMTEIIKRAVLPQPPPVVLSVASPVPLPHHQTSAVGTAARRWEWIPTWLGSGFGARLSDWLGTEVLVENDANLAALGELRYGSGRGRSDMVHLMLGEHSIGTGMVMGGRLIRGGAGLAGELAHVQVRANGRVCHCGGRGCLLATITQELIELAQPAYDEQLTFASVLRLAATGDIGLQRVLADVGRAIGRPLADLCTMLNPSTVVLDGSVGPAGVHILRGLTDAIERYASPAMAAAATVTLGTLGDEAQTLGAVALLRDEWSRT